MHSVDVFNQSSKNSGLGKIKHILEIRYSNGYRLNSPIELMRFKSFFENEWQESIYLSDKDLEKCISDCGVLFENKIYVVSDETKEMVKKSVNEYLSSGAQIIFFSEFYKKNESWLFDRGIVKDEMLIEILWSQFPELKFKRNYFGSRDELISNILVEEILRVWGNHTLQSYNQIAEKLQYVPVEKIKKILGSNCDFLRNSRETFSHISKVEITSQECESIRTVAKRQCDRYNSVLIEDLPVDEIQEQNCELSIMAIQSAVYQICLSDLFDKNDKILKLRETIQNPIIEKDAVNRLKE